MLRQRVADYYGLPDYDTLAIDNKIRELAKQLKVCNLDGITFDRISGDTMLRLAESIGVYLDGK